MRGVHAAGGRAGHGDQAGRDQAHMVGKDWGVTAWGRGGDAVGAADSERQEREDEASRGGRERRGVRNRQ